jgi:hypothetical protein
MTRVKAYLGDSVYASWEGDMILLTTENGYGASNVIYLEPRVYKALLRWVEDTTTTRGVSDGQAD